jgi:iron complex transport system substrate-binding protein
MTRRRSGRARGWLLGALLAIGLAACGGAAPTAAPPSGTTPTAAAATTAPAPTATRGTATAPSTATRPSGTATRAAVGTVPRTAAPGSPTVSPRAGATPRVTSYPLTVRDDSGRTVTIARRPQRIISLAPSNTEILFALGLGDRVVGVDAFSNYPPAAASKPRISNYSSTDLEQVLAATPDLILAAGITKKDVITAFESRGLATLVLAPADLPGVLENISLVGQVADINAETARLRGDLEGRIAAVEARLRGTTTKPRAFLELDPTQFFSAGPKSFIDDLITRAGGSNIAGDAGTPFPKLSPEEIIAKDPQVILLADGSQGVTPDSVKARPGWAGISAVRTGRIVVLDEDVYLRPGPRSVDALEGLVRFLHPELFR